jgi:DNA-binding response OmpR family regulator
MATILAVDDDPQILTLLTHILGRAGYTVETAGTGASGLEMAVTRPYELIILDVMLPDLDGIDVCKRIRTVSQTPVLMLTGMDAEYDKVAGLEGGADDYVTKPFGSWEFLARVRALIRRGSLVSQLTTSTPPPSRVTYRALDLDLISRRATMAGKLLRLKPREFDLLAMLVSHPGKAFSSEDLLKSVWGYEDTSDVRTIAVHVRRLREQVEADPSNPTLIQTVRGLGYKLAE